MQYIPKLKIICIEEAELEGLFSHHKKLEIVDKLNASGLKGDELFNADAIMKAIVKPISHETANDRDEHEIFVTLELLKFFKSGSQVCFELIRSFDPKKDSIVTLDDLNKFREGQSSTDFAIKSDDELRSFQLTRHRGKYETKTILETIKKKLGKMANENLLVILQSETDTQISTTLFHQLHEELKSLAKDKKGEILIVVNNNHSTEIYKIHPQLAKTSSPYNQNP